MEISEVVSLGWCYISRHSNHPKHLRDLCLQPLKTSPSVSDRVLLMRMSQSFSSLKHKELLDINLPSWIASSIWGEQDLLEYLWFDLQRLLLSPTNNIAFVDVHRELLDFQLWVMVYEPTDYRVKYFVKPGAY